MKKFVVWPIFVTFLLLLGLCMSLQPGTSSLNAIKYRTVVDATGTEVKIPEKPQRVVVLNSANLDMYYAAGGKVIGKPSSSYLSPALRRATKDVPSIGTIHSPSVEAIIGLKPDLVIGVNVPYNTAIREMLAQVGIPLYINDLNTYEEMIKTMRFFGELTGETQQTETVIAKAQNTYYSLVNQARQYKGARTLIIFGAPGSFSMATESSFSGNLLKILGGENITAQNQLIEGDYVPLSMEYVIEYNPEVIFFISMIPKSDSVAIFKKDMVESPAWSQVKAVQSGRIYYLSGGLYAVNPGTRITEAMQGMYTDLYEKEVARNGHVGSKS